MKNYQILAIALLALSSCGVRSGEKASIDSAKALTDTAITPTALVAEMSIRDTIKIGDSVLLKFTVKNNKADTARFLKWHTPFEPLLSKYLDIKDENGTEVNYKGAMAKRMMPPPGDSYITLKANESLSATADLLKGYAIDKPAKYTITYNSTGVSGLTVKNTVSFVYIR
ncbi:protease [Mucilaginibacter lutimaris]|uniref:Protease n=1 Tax=Mucilaginibacter lutimaris TaxID=931629 RepID=A0ABW2ZF03_9SPHI